MSKLLIVLAIIVAVLVISEAAVVPPALQHAIQPRDGANCKCMPWRNCQDGRINDAVNCHQSYIMICCIIEPEVARADEKTKIIPMEID